MITFIKSSSFSKHLETCNFILLKTNFMGFMQWVTGVEFANKSIYTERSDDFSKSHSWFMTQLDGGAVLFSNSAHQQGKYSKHISPEGPKQTKLTVLYFFLSND